MARREWAWNKSLKVWKGFRGGLIDYGERLLQAEHAAEAVPMTEAVWTSEKSTEAGWYWNRISGAVGIALITRRDGRLYAWLKFKDAWLTREGWLDYIHGEWLGPITPDSYVRGRVEGLT